MAAALVLEARVGAAAVYLEDDFLEATLLAAVRREHLDLPALGFGVARVHTEEVAGEQRSLFAAGTAADLDDYVAFVVGIGRQEGELEVVVEALPLRFQRQQFVAGEARHLGVIAVLELLRLVDLLLDAAQLAVDAHNLVELGTLL